MPNSPIILIVDDESKILELLDETLRMRGYETLLARNGEQALKIVEKQMPDLIITDVMLPRLDGFAMVEQVRARNNGKEIPIIMMSAVYRDLQVKEKAFKDFAVDFLVKPFSLVDLLNRLKELFPFADINLRKPPGARAMKTSPKKAEEENLRHLSGQIGNFSVPLLMISFFSEKKTGVLYLSHGKRVSKIFFEKGIPIFAEGRVRKDDPEEISRLLRSSMSWTAGDYVFEEKKSFSGEITRYPHDFYEMIYEGARRYYKLELLIDKLKDFQNHFVMPTPKFEEILSKIKFNDEEKEILSKIDGYQSVSQLVALGHGNLDHVFQILWILEFLEAIILDPNPLPTPNSSVSNEGGESPLGTPTEADTPGISLDELSGGSTPELLPEPLSDEIPEDPPS